MSDRKDNPHRKVAPTVPREQFDAVLGQRDRHLESWRTCIRNAALAQDTKVRYREALEQIAEAPCDNNDTGDEDECPALGVKPLCPTCEARAALREDT